MEITDWMVWSVIVLVFFILSLPKLGKVVGWISGLVRGLDKEN